MRYLLIVLLFLGCGSRKVDKQQKKESTKIELSEIQHENAEELELSKRAVQTNIHEFDFSVFENFNFSYEGISPDDSIELKKTKNGWTMKGAGKANLSKNKGSSSKSKTTNQNKVNNAVKATKSENNEQNNHLTNSEKTELDKKTERKNNSGWYWSLGLFGSLALIFVGVFIYKRLKKN